MRSTRHRRLRPAAALALLWLVTRLAACVTTDPTAPREYLDEVTAATVTVAGGGLVFARARTDFAINARDYVTIVPVDVNRTGTHALYLYCYVWSTIDRPTAPQRTENLEIVADGRQIPLTPVGGSPRGVGIGAPPVEPPSLNALPLVSATNREVLQFLVRAGDLRLLATRDGQAERYDLWSDERAAIEAFLHGGPP